MSNNPLVAAPVIPAEPIGEVQPAPTPEQERAADQLFARPEAHNVALDLVGMVAATQLLHDLAIETFRRSERPETDPEKQPEEPEADQQ
jgi:hypothetical protein